MPKFQDYDKLDEEKYQGFGGGGDWMRLEVGDNVIRIVSEFEDYGSHWDQGQSRYFTCTGKETCPYCKMTDKNGNALKPTVKYLGWVIDRKDKQVKLLTIGHSIFKDIGKLAQNKEYKFGDLPGYDITIVRTGQGKETRYSIIAARSDTELTEEEKAEIKNVAKNSPADVIENMKNKSLEIGETDDEINTDEIPF